MQTVTKQVSRFYKATLLPLPFLLFFLATNENLGAQVNLQTGSATFSLPIFSWKDNHSRLYNNIALSYNSGNGLKVNEVASNVGQGWSLVAGGIITRIQMGEPDDQIPNGTGDEFDVNRYPAGYLYASISPSKGCPVALTNYPIYGSQNQLYTQHNIVAEDKQLDYFSFQFNGKAGMFVLNKSTNTGVSIGDSKIKIAFQTNVSVADGSSEGIRTSIVSFSIQDVDGLIYKFTKCGFAKVMRLAYSDENLVESQRQPTFKDNRVYDQAVFNDVRVNPWMVNSWSLTEVEDALTHAKVLFNYPADPLYVDSRAGEDLSYNKGDRKYCIITHRRSITKTPEISSIVYPDGHVVNFGYDTGAPRVDLVGEYPLSSIDVNYGGRHLSKFNLTTSYFILNRFGKPITDYQKRVARLCLRSVQKIGPDLKEDSPPYSFDYYTGSNASGDFVPPPFSHLKDIWGFYNGDNSQKYFGGGVPFTVSASELRNRLLRNDYFYAIKGLCFLHEVNNQQEPNYYTAKEKYAQNGLLKQIVYPTGGTLEYKYDQNVGVIEGVARMASGVHVSETRSTDGGFSNDCSNPLVTTYHYTADSINSSLWGLEKPENSVTITNNFKPKGKYYHWTLSSFPVGECAYDYKYPGILSQQQALDLPVSVQILNSAAPVLGILNIISTVKDIVAATGGNPGSLIIDLILDVAQAALSCFLNPDQTKQATTYYNFDLHSANPLPAQFKRVEIVENTGTAGRTIQTFTSKDDYGLWSEQNPTFSSRQRFAPWAYGLPLKTTVKDRYDNIVSEIENTYNFDTHYYKTHCNVNIPRYDRRMLLKQPLSLIGCKCTVKKSYSEKAPDWRNWSNPSVYDDPNNFIKSIDNNDMSADVYDLYTGRTELEKSTERKYTSGAASAFVETTKQFVYNDDNYQLTSINTVGSDGKYNVQNFFYTIDFVKMYGSCYTPMTLTTSNPEIISMVQKNIIGELVEENRTIADNVYGEHLNQVGGTATVFTTLSNGDIKPTQKWEMRFAQPTGVSSIWQEVQGGSTNDYIVGPALFNPDNPGGSGSSYSPNAGPSAYKLTQQFTYDNQGDLIALKDEGNRQVTNLYGYDNKYVVASVVNAQPSDYSGYASFEEPALGNGWTLSVPNGGSLVFSPNAVTGSRALVLSSNMDLSGTLNSNTASVISFWATGSLSVNNGAVLTKTALGINGYTYYEYEVPAGNASVSITGAAIIDEARHYPKDARMRTVAYDPLIGKTAECDENNRITYYEYDNLGRLQFVKDDKKNVVKMYEYNNVSPAKLNGCPGLYYNLPIAETYAKNNCGPGYIGSEVPVTVPPNTFSSALSQADADAQAEAYLLANGQNTANANGTCIQLYYNTAQSKTFDIQTCPEGYVGGTYTYFVPADKYSSTISQEDADQKAQDDIAANGQGIANDPANQVCTFDNHPHWVAAEGAQTDCRYYNGQPYIYMLATDMNPNSSSYGQTSWQNTFQPGSCPPGSCDYTECNNRGPAYRCINGNCEPGVKIYTGVYSDYSTDPHYCIYHYEWSDGSWSVDYYEGPYYGNQSCLISQ